MCAPRRSVECEQWKARLWGSLTFNNQKRRMRLLGELEGAASEVREKAGGKYFREWWSGQQCWKQPEIKYQYWWFCVAMNQHHCFWKSPLETRWFKKKRRKEKKGVGRGNLESCKTKEILKKSRNTYLVPQFPPPHSLKENYHLKGHFSTLRAGGSPEVGVLKTTP